MPPAQAYGPRHQEVARDLSHIGSLLCDLHRLEEAADSFREAHQLDATALGAEHVHTATDLGGFGLVLVAQRRWREALPPLQQCQRVLQASLEATHPHLQAVASALQKCALEVALEAEKAHAGDNP